MCLIYTPPAAWLCWQLHQASKRNVKDSMGLVVELIGAASCMIGCYLLFVILTWFSYDVYVYQFNYYYIMAIQPTLYCILWIIYPSLYNTTRAHNIRNWIRLHVLHRRIHVGNQLDDVSELIQIIQSTLGFKYMLVQCKSEFSEETLHCLKAIWRFKSKPNYPKLIQLFVGFIEDGSPFQVNIAASSRERISELIHSIPPECSVIEIEHIYDGVEQELMNLLINNSFVRFKKSIRYPQYLAGEPINDRVDTSDVTCTGDSSELVTSHGNSLLTLHTSRRTMTRTSKMSYDNIHPEITISACSPIQPHDKSNNNILLVYRYHA